MERSLDVRDVSPVAEMNATPLIDVLLVLLVMFIITMPLQSHAVKLDLPGRAPVPERVDLLRNVIVVTNSNQILWNGAPVTKSQIRSLLAASARLRPSPEIHLQPQAQARYDLVDQLLAETKRAGLTRMGFVGNESYATF